MNFMDAINCGKRVRTEGHNFMARHRLIDILKESKNFEDAYRFINSEFEIEERSITITEQDYDDAIERAATGYKGMSFDFAVKKELGFLE